MRKRPPEVVADRGRFSRKTFLMSTNSLYNNTPDMPPPFLADIERAVMNRQGRQRGEEITFQCPREGHEDRHPSARYNPRKAVWTCDVCKRGGGAFDLAALLGISKPAPPPPPRPIRPNPKIVATYDYADADGNVLFQKVRYDPKKFSQRRPDGKGGWIDNLRGVETVLYRLPDLLATDGMVVLVEGEKDADLLWSLGIPATTAPMGAKKWNDRYTAALAGREVAILPDHDDDGHAHGQMVAPRLHAAGCGVRVVDLPGLPDKGDVFDWIEVLGFTADDLREVIADTPAWAPEPRSYDSTEYSQDSGHPLSPTMITAADLMAKTFPDPRWAVEGFVPEGLTIYAGPPKIGKSWFMLNAGVGVALGGMVAGAVPADPGDVLYLALEDTERRLQERLHRVLQGGQPPSRLHLATQWPTLAEGGTAHLDTWLTTHPDARLVVVDTFQKLRGPATGDKQLYAADYAVAGQLKAVADRHGVAIVCVHHTRKAMAEDPIDTVSGTTGLAGAADTICVLRKEIGKADGTLYVRGRDVQEASHALSFDPVTCCWTLMGDAAEYRRSGERRAILDLLSDTGAPMTPTQIAEALDKKANAVRVLLHKMAKAGEVDGLGGLYRLPLTPLYIGNTTNASNPGNAGNAGNVPTPDSITGPESTGNAQATQNPQNSGQNDPSITGITGITGVVEAGPATAPPLPRDVRAVMRANGFSD